MLAKGRDSLGQAACNFGQPAPDLCQRHGFLRYNPDDRQRYLHLLLEQSRRYGVTFWAYCLMDNHVHFIAIPQRSESLARTFGEAHRRYSSVVNRREGWTGYLWQGRFASFPLDPAHSYAAVRYVERNPVKAGLVRRAEDYPWSSARAHVRQTHDPLLAPLPLMETIGDWAAFLQESDEDTAEAMARSSRTGRPFGPTGFVEGLEQFAGRPLRPQRPGRKPKSV